jgi:hypothetical protein
VVFRLAEHAQRRDPDRMNVGASYIFALDGRLRGFSGLDTRSAAGRAA